LNPLIRVYRYTKGQFFDCHCKLKVFSILHRANLKDDVDPEKSWYHPKSTICSPYVDDESNVLSLPTSPKPTPARTTWTLLLYLTSPATGCQGGQTVFYPDDLPHKNSLIGKEVVVELETGMLLLHKHGIDCMLVSLHVTQLDLQNNTGPPLI
jgi:hypothetical protein